MKINGLQKPSRTETSYDEVKMDLFVPPGGKTQNLYARVYIPAELQKLYGGRVEIRKSTKTADRVLAKTRAAAFALEMGRDFLEKRKLLQDVGSSKVSEVVLDTSLIQKIAHLRLANLVEFDDLERNSMEDDSEWEEHEKHIKDTIEDLRKIISRRKKATGYETYARDWLGFAETAGHAINESDPMLPALIDAMAKADKRGYELMSQRSDGNVVALSPGESGPWLRELLEAWEREHAHHLPEKTRGTYKSRIETFIEFTDDKLVAHVEQKDVWDWLNKLTHDHKLAEKTIKDGYLPALRSLFDYAVVSGKFNIKRNPAKDIRAPKLSKKEAASREQPRETFNSIYLNQIFASQWYAGISQPIGGLRTVAVTTGNARYWVPLIACFQGFRGEEVCQLTLVDVGMQSGVFSLRVTDEAGRVKNVESQRWVPVHPLLLTLGFREYVDAMRTQQRIPEAADFFVERGPGEKYIRPTKAGALFPELHTKSESRSNTLLKKFNGFIREELKFEVGYSYHSFRHYWEDVRRKVMAADAAAGDKWPQGMSERISGRSQAHIEEAEGSSALYGGELPPNLMKPYLDRMKFEGMRLPKSWSDFQAS